MSAQLITALQDCVSVMERDLNGLAVIQPELKQAREALDAALAPPPAWTGEGLPPVGTELECGLACEGFKTWHKGVCVAIGIDPEDRDEICVVKIGDKIAMYTTYGGRMRPIRTPEQISAEDREKAIFHMQRLIEESDKHGAFDQLGALYDAGLRFSGGDA